MRVYVLLSTILAFAVGCINDHRDDPPIGPPLVRPPCGGGFGDGVAGGPCIEPPHPFTNARELPKLTHATTPPPAIAGGTLLVSEDGLLALAAEPARDLVQVVTLTSGPVVYSIALRAGDEPGRLLQVGDDFFAVLRGAGSLAKLGRNPTSESWEVLDRIPVCASPRGVDYDADQNELLVSCLSGAFVGVDATTGAERSRTQLSDDLRDVVVTDGHVFVSRFRSAEVLVLSRESRELQNTVRLADFHFDRFVMLEGSPRANVAYRMVQSGPDQVMLSHQLSSSETPIETRIPGGYGGGGDCVGSIVSAGVSMVGPEGVVSGSSQGNLVLPVDLAISPTVPGEAAIAVAGSRTKGIPAPSEAPAFDGASRAAPTAGPVGMVRFDDHGGVFSLAACEGSPNSRSDERRTVAVAYTGTGELIQQTWAPATLIIGGQTVELPGEEVFDAGHDLFFGDAGGGIACASCHAEGGDDGLTWNFAELGPRRTQELRGGIMDSAPFHWDGEMETFSQLTNDVMGDRMGGPELPTPYVDALANY
ncbi:MAG: hypothetical protein AAGF12_32670, partial [Myxococcota bacterium]